MPQLGSTNLRIGLALIILHAPVVYNGFACLSNPCFHGVCLDDLNSTYFCYCIDGYTGLQCQTNWNDCWSAPCQNGGICLDGIASFNCTCPSGFIGDFCEEDLNECESNPCWNNGTCVDGPNGYNCQCLPGYSGIHCEIDIAVCNTTGETRCRNGGACQEGPGDTFSCRCQPGWTGFLCDIEVDECMSAPCQNGAVCIDIHANYECACLFGFTGRNCEEIIKICDKNPCKNGALCLIEDNLPICYCVPDFHGELCQLQYDECVLGPKCLNGGTCIDGIDNFTCSCPPNLTGMFCECLSLPSNQIDCTYVASSTTTESYPNITTKTTLFETESTTKFLFSETPKVTTQAEPKASTTQVPNATIQITESPTVPYCITQSPPTTIPANTTFGTTSMINTSSEVQTSTISSTTYSEITSSSTSQPSEISTPIEETSTYIPTGSSSGLVPSTEWPRGTEKVSTTTAEIETSSQTDVRVTTEEYPESTTTSIESEIIEFPTYSTQPNGFHITTITEETSTSNLTTKIPSTTTVEITTKSEVNFTIPSISTIRPTLETTSRKDLEHTTETTLTYPPSTTELTIDETTIKDKESNRTFPEERATTTFLPSLSTFFTEHPSAATTESVSATSEQNTITESLLSTTAGIDCTLTEKRCRNGGTCIFTGEGYKCICPFDTEGNYCETKLGVKNAAFNGNSYLTHRLLENQNISIEFEAKTLSSHGLLFYSHLGKTYMALYVDDGFLMFKFSCGYQTMLLSELKIPVNNGLKLNIKADLEFSNDFKHCDSHITINDTLAMMGDQMAKIDRFSKSTPWLHLGGIPNDILYDTVPTGGFIGCISNLKISGKKVHIYKDADDGYEISECSSLACLSNPCKNGASCSSHEDSWVCHCRNGYLGQMCEISICNNNPCLFGGTCIPFSNSGYICLCPYGKHGHFCESDLKITEPYFSSSVRGLSSFVAHPLPEGISQKMEIKFRFTPTTMEQISLLLFIGQNGQHDFYSDHLAVSFVKGYIMLTWNMGSGPRRIFTSQPIEDGARDYLVHLGYDSRRAWLYVDNLGNVTGRSPGNAVQLDIMPWIYLGGHDSKNFSTLPHDLPLHTGFSGCVFDVEVKIGIIVLPLQGSLKAFGRAVGQCGTTECYEKSCQNGGACLHHGSTFMCLCQDHWFGPLCSSKTNFCDANYTTCAENSICVPLLASYECDCSYGKLGANCDKEENVTDISFTGRRSYLATKPLEMDSSKFNIEMEIRMLKDTGIVFFLGKKESGFICLSLQNGLLELRVHSTKTRASLKDPLTVRSSKLLLKGVWHKVQFGVFGRKVYLYVDHLINLGVLDHGFMLSLPEDSIYLGGLPDMSKLPASSSSSFPIPYTGCLRYLTINENKVPLTPENISKSRNIIDCDGTPCGGEACLNGGTCWLDSFLYPHCSCVEPYYGEKCELSPLCSEKNCKNGKCENATCTCHIGFEGGFCETEIEVKTPAFVGKSYLIVHKLGDKKRNIRDLELKKLYLNFTTAKSNGLLVWTRRDSNSFLGLGLERGYLKLIFSSGLTQEKTVEVVPYHKMSDGLWHSVEIHFVPLLVNVDKKLLKLSENKIEEARNLTVFTNGVFFIGGMPDNTSLVQETNGMFSKNFDGCIEAFGTNAEKIITNFMPFEGVNINNCNIH